MRKITVMASLLGILMIASAFVQTKNPPQTMVRGKALYTTYCMSCHMEDGKGMENVYPPLAKSDFLKKPAKDLIENILKGQSGEVKVNGVVYNAIMPAQDYLKDEEIADILNYFTNAWGNKNLKLFTPAQVKKLR